jgi:RNA polymerase sigma factor (sigma-70 family)
MASLEWTWATVKDGRASVPPTRSNAEPATDGYHYLARGARGSWCVHLAFNFTDVCSVFTVQLPKDCPRFTAEEENALHTRMQQGDQEAKDLLARSVLPWAISVVRRYAGRGVADDELEGIAYLGVAETLNRWEPPRGRLTTAVVWSIRSVFQKHLADMAGPVHVPVYLLDGRAGDDANRNASKLPEYREAAKRALRGKHRSLDAPLPGKYSEGEKTLGQILTARSGRDVLSEMIYAEDLEIMRFKYKWAMDHITKPRLRLLLQKRWEAGLTLEEVGESFNVSRERIRQLELRAKKQFYALIAKAPDPAIEARPMSGGLIPSVRADDSLGVSGKLGALRDVNISDALSCKTASDIANEIAELDKQFAAVEGNYRGKREMLKVLHRALLKRDETKLSPDGEAEARGSNGDKCLAVYNYLRARPASTVNQIVAVTGFTKSTVNYILTYHKGKKFKKVDRGQWSIIPGVYKDGKEAS